MAAAGAHLPLWDPSNVKEGDFIIHTELLQVLNESAPTLCKTLQLQKLWPYLIQLQVLDTNDEERIKHCGARPDQVLELLSFIKKGPRWQYHALMRAMALTGQRHLVPEGGPGPEVYADHEPQAAASETEDETQPPMPPELLEIIGDHCKYYKEFLMRAHIFAFDSDPGDDYVNITQLYINTHPKTKDGHKTMVPIAATKVLEKVGDSDSPLVVRLYGQPGDGKTSFTMHIAYSWSIAFLDQVTKKDGKLSLKSKCPLWTTMVFIKARNIKTTVEDAIREGLGCKEKDEETMMAHVKQGKGVAILVEAMDELHDQKAIEQLKQYVKKCKKNGGPTILITSRTDLCCIDGQDFDRFLTLEGFSEEQALEYVKLYTETCKESVQTPSKVNDYVTRHKDMMKGVLSNPLQLHLYCALAMRGELELTENSEFNIPKLFGPLEKHLLRRGGTEVTKEQSNAFYRLCMHAILNDVREFPEALLNEFNIVPSYYIFMHKSDRRGPDGRLRAYYSFAHEMVLEYFGSKYIYGLSTKERLSFLFVICSDSKWRNIQLIIIHLLLQDNDMPQKDLIQTMIRIILINELCKDEQNSIHSGDLLKSMKLSLVKVGIYGQKERTRCCLKQMEDELKLLRATLPEDMLHPNRDNITNLNVSGNLAFMNDAFDKYPDILQDEGLYNMANGSGTIDHVVQCLEACAPGLRDDLVQRTILPLFPWQSEYTGSSFCGVGGTRWAECRFTYLAPYIRAWCPADAAEMLVQYAAMYKDQSTSRNDSLCLDINQRPGLWGEPDAAHWSQQEWTKLLLHLPRKCVRGAVFIRVHDTAPLTGLLGCLLHHAELLSQCSSVDVYHGRSELAELQDLISRGQTCQQAGVRLRLGHTTILTPEGACRDQVTDLVRSVGLFSRPTKVKHVNK